MPEEPKTKRELLKELDALSGHNAQLERTERNRRNKKLKKSKQTFTNTFNDTAEGIHLTASEIRVLRLIVKGLSNKQIAQALHRSVRTIEGHRAHLMQKLGVDNSIELVSRAVAMGLVDMQVEQRPKKAT